MFVRLFVTGGLRASQRDQMIDQKTLENAILVAERIGRDAHCICATTRLLKTRYESLAKCDFSERPELLESLVSAETGLVDSVAHDLGNLKLLALWMETLDSLLVEKGLPTEFAKELASLPQGSRNVGKYRTHPLRSAFALFAAQVRWFLGEIAIELSSIQTLEEHSPTELITPGFFAMAADRIQAANKDQALRLAKSCAVAMDKKLPSDCADDAMAELLSLVEPIGGGVTKPKQVSSNMGVTYFDAAMHIEEGDKQAATEKTREWTKRHLFAGVEKLGKDPGNMKRPLAGLAGIVKIVAEYEGLNEPEKRLLRDYLKTQLRAPAKET